MKSKPISRFAKLAVAMLLTAATLFGVVSCKPKDPLDPDKPVTIKFWHYYPKHVATAVDALVEDFNETVGKQRGVVVEMENKGTQQQLMSEVLDAASNDPQALPNLFLSNSDNAFIADKQGLLANIGKYFSAAELSEYHQSFIEEGKIGKGSKLKLFPLAKATEVLVLNQTDWAVFAADKKYTHADLATYEGIAKVAADYYKWTDAKTPSVPHDGKAFLDSGSVANMLFAAEKQFDGDVFEVLDSKGSLAVTDETLKKLWDYYYVPYISGHYSYFDAGEGIERGDTLAFVDSANNAYIPTTVKNGDDEYDITPAVLPMPIFDDGKEVLVAQGDGMAVTKANYKTEYASAVFLKWFTDTVPNSVYALCGDAIPAKTAATDYDAARAITTEKGYGFWSLHEDIIKPVYERINSGAELFAPKAFEGGGDARVILENHLKNTAVLARMEVEDHLRKGTRTYAELIAEYSSSDSFVAWKNDFKYEIQQVIQ